MMQKRIKQLAHVRYNFRITTGVLMKEMTFDHYAMLCEVSLESMKELIAEGKES